VRGKIIILVAMLALLIYNSLIYYSGIVYAQSNAYPGYDQRFDLLIGGIQIEITGATPWGGPGFSKGFCSLAFPVTFIEDGYRKKGFITAGHCIDSSFGGDYVDQPRKSSWWDWSNYIGRGIRTTWPKHYLRSDQNLDAALIRIEGSRDISAFIFENGDLYYGYDKSDFNKKVGIMKIIRPWQRMENITIVYKSGRTTGLTYGLIEKIDDRVSYWRIPEIPVTIKPVIRISKCPEIRNGQCYYNGVIAAPGDSGGPVYIRELIYYIKVGPDEIRHYGGKVLGIVSGVSRDGKYLMASWATKVKERWNDVEYLTCEFQYYYTCW
jgi:hypothetical protein